MKTLYVLISNGGDGSYSIHYTFDSAWIEVQENRDDHDYEYDVGVDGDGFHYDTLQVPDECTLESLGIRSDVAVEQPYPPEVEE